MAYDADPGGSQSTAAGTGANALGAGDVGWTHGGGGPPSNGSGNNAGAALGVQRAAAPSDFGWSTRMAPQSGDVGWTQGGGGPQSLVAGGSSGVGLTPPAISPDQMLKAGILKHIASGEASSYNELYGGGTFDGYSKFPNWSGVETDDGMTHAAGLYQFQPATWNAQAQKLGLKDFSPESQDSAAFNLASETYKQQTGRDIMDDAAKGSVSWGALGGQWSSLKGQKPSGVGGGSQPTSTGQSQSRAQTSDAGPSDQGQAQPLSMDSMNALLAYQAAYPGLQFTAMNENPFGGESKNG